MRKTFLCAKYDYELDMQVKAEEAREDGIEEGRSEKAIEDAIMLVHDYNATPEVAAQKNERTARISP